LKNALVRYWSNNFADGRRQDAIGLFLGHVDPKVVPVEDIDVVGNRFSKIMFIDKLKNSKKIILLERSENCKLKVSAGFFFIFPISHFSFKILSSSIYKTDISDEAVRKSLRIA